MHWLNEGRPCVRALAAARARQRVRPPTRGHREAPAPGLGRPRGARSGRGLRGGGHVCVRDTRVRETRRRRARRRPGAPRGARRGREARDFRCVGRAEAPRGRCGRQGDRWGEGLAAASRSLRRKQGQGKVIARAPAVRLARDRGAGTQRPGSVTRRPIRLRGVRLAREGEGGRPDAASCGRQLTTLPPGGARARVRARDTG